MFNVKREPSNDVPKCSIFIGLVGLCEDGVGFRPRIVSSKFDDEQGVRVSSSRISEAKILWRRRLHVCS